MGRYGILQKVHQTSEYKQELDGFLMISFVCSILANAVLLLLEYRKGERISNSFWPTKKGFWLVLLAAIGIAIPNKFNLYLSGVMDSAVFFPLVNGGGLLLNLLAAVILFRERPTKMQLVGFVIGMVAILLLGM